MPRNVSPNLNTPIFHEENITKDSENRAINNTAIFNSKELNIISENTELTERFFLQKIIGEIGIMEGGKLDVEFGSCQPPYFYKEKIKKWEKDTSGYLIKREDIIVINRSSKDALKSSPHFNLDTLLRGEKYIWIINLKGEAIICQENDPNSDSKEYLGHPCLTGEGGRIGGELVYRKDEGKICISARAGRFCYQDRTEEHLKNVAELVSDAFGEIGLPVETEDIEEYRKYHEKKAGESKLYPLFFQSLAPRRFVSA